MALFDNFKLLDPQNPTDQKTLQYIHALKDELVNVSTAHRNRNANYAVEAFKNAQLTINALKGRIGLEEWHVYWIIFKVIQLMYLDSRALNFREQERYEKAIETCTEAMEIYKSVKIELEKVPRTVTVIPYFANDFPSFRNQILHLEVTQEANFYIFKNELAKRDNLGILNEIEILEKVIETYKKIDKIDYEIDNSSIYKSSKNYAETKIAQNEVRLENLKKQLAAAPKYIIPHDRKVFIVHGHDHAVRDRLQGIITEKFGLEAVILSEEDDEGTTVIDKFEKHASGCGFAFVIVTADDLVENNGKEYFQGRPNVLFELGWFFGRFGRKRVRIIKERGTQMPSDLLGVLSINFDKDLDDPRVIKKIEMALSNSDILKD